MRILVVGGGGREHALCWALAREAQVFCAPGNPGTASVAANISVNPSDPAGLVGAIRAHRIDLTVIGPEAPLAAGLVDYLVGAGHQAFGPTAAAARIEASKAFAKEVAAATAIPTAASRTFTIEREALEYLQHRPAPIVVKASGLAAGKGVVVCQTRAEAKDAVRRMFGGLFGPAGREVVIEEFLAGEELSVLGLTDGEQLLLLPPSQDHKRLGEGDVGPNTGGMGAYAPVTIADDALLRRVAGEIFQPVLQHLAEHGAPYRGILYAGIMLCGDGVPRLLEFNCRLGDPEAQVVLPVAQIALAEHLWSIAAHEVWRPGALLCPAHGAAVTTVLAAQGYPTAPVRGAEIRLPDPLPEHTLLFHAGTVRDESGRLRADGGRVLCATGLGKDVPAAAERSRALAAAVDFGGKVYRRDIAWREVARAGAS